MNANEIDVTDKYAASLDYATLPRDEGQIVTASYAVAEVGSAYALFRRLHDAADGSVSYAYRMIRDDNTVEFDPINGTLPRCDGEWKCIGDDTADILAIAKLLLASGPTFSGGSDDSALVAAREWDGCDFTLDGVRLWVAAEVWTPSVADALNAAGVIPHKLVAAVGSEAIYATCNGDMAVADLISAYEAE